MIVYWSSFTPYECVWRFGQANPCCLQKYSKEEIQFSLILELSNEGMLENSERSVRGVRMGKSGPLERAELANQIQGLRILDHWDASEKKKLIDFFHKQYHMKVHCLIAFIMNGSHVAHAGAKA